MAAVYRFKRHESRLIKKSRVLGKFLAEKGAAFFRGLGRRLYRSYTLVFIHHSEKKFRNMHITFLSICAFFLFQFGLISTVIWMGISSRIAKKTMIDKDIQLNAVQANLDNLRDESTELFKEILDFETTLSGSLSVLNIDTGIIPGLYQEADVRINTEKNNGVYYREINDVRQLKEYLSSVVKEAADLRSVIDFQNAVFTGIPCIWPIKDGLGRITSPFGRTRHPYTGQWYLHRGIDFSTYRQGDPVVATADGQVVTAEYDKLGGFGNYIIIRHKHGYYTRYGHLLSFKAKIGDKVRQGDVIGYIGNTGLSTGPHLHYEIHAGSDVVDPNDFIRLRSDKNLADLAAFHIP
jgi:murein DD-endopeptidase MepM/ murein hydrolase activator NlpD